MVAALDELSQAVAGGPGALTSFFAGRDFPLVEGSQALFVYQGQAHEVRLRHWIYALPQTQVFRRLDGSDVWVLEMKLPRCSRVEYKLEVDVPGGTKLVADPLNPNHARDPYGANSVAFGEGYEPPSWVEHDPEVRPGSIEELQFKSDVLDGSPRPLQVYLPARYRRTRRYPLLIAHDGADYLRFSALQTVLDNLIHRLEIPPMVAVLTQSPKRLEEYSGDDRHADFLAKELVPLMEERYPLVGRPEARCLLGASFGGVAALHAAWKHPGVFGRLCLQSGSFAFTDIGDHDRGPVFDAVVEFVNAFRDAPGVPSERVYLSCGIYESLIYYNRSLLPLLQSTGMDVRLDEVRDGHNWENWRDRLRDALSWLMPGPLWMVYE